MPAPRTPTFTRPFHWQDGERAVFFGEGALEEAAGELRDGFTLLTTERARVAAPALEPRAARVVLVPPGLVDDIAAELRDDVAGPGQLVALGGGRVIDVAKALAAAHGEGSRVAAIPTTLSGAEMTRVHRHARGVPAETPRVRPSVVVNDPGLSASQPEADLAASALNALGHAAEAPLTTLANPVSTLAALEAARRIGEALTATKAGEDDRDSLALAALLAGYSIDSAGYGLHHVLSQTVVRFGGAGHGPANAVMLPHALRALARRTPEGVQRLGDALGGEAPAVAADLTARTGATRLRDLGVERSALERCAEEASGRPELHLTPPAADIDELRELYEVAW